MAGNYEKSIYNQLMEVMERLDKAEQRSQERLEKAEQRSRERLEKAEQRSRERYEKAEQKHQREKDELDAKINSLHEEVSDLQQKNDDLLKENKLLKDDNARLRSIINNDSSNSSLPPSGDQKGGKSSAGRKRANEYNGRQKSNRNAGGQKGHKGSTLTKADIEKKLQEEGCIHEVRDIGKASSSSRKYVSKFILDLDVQTKVTELRFYPDKQGKYHIPPEYRSDVIYGDNVKAMAVTLYADGVMSNEKITGFLNELSGGLFELSAGSVYNFCSSFSESAAAIRDALEEELLSEGVVGTDATTISVDGKQRYIRNFSSEKSVIYYPLESKKLDELEEITFLKKYAGTLVHDHETALYHCGTGHGECNVHVLRYLRKNDEETGNEWSKEMRALLCEANEARKSLIESGKTAFDDTVIAEYEKRYFDLIEKGKEENKRTEHKYAKKDEKTLLNRLTKYSENHLLFLHDFEVSFDNNMSERDLRKVKNRQKMSGGFRKWTGQEMYCRSLSVVETLKRRGMNLLENIRLILAGTPAKL